MQPPLCFTTGRMLIFVLVLLKDLLPLEDHFCRVDNNATIILCFQSKDSVVWQMSRDQKQTQDNDDYILCTWCACCTNWTTQCSDRKLFANLKSNKRRLNLAALFDILVIKITIWKLGNWLKIYRYKQIKLTFFVKFLEKTFVVNSHYRNKQNCVESLTLAVYLFSYSRVALDFMAASLVNAAFGSLLVVCEWPQTCLWMCW